MSPLAKHFIEQGIKLMQINEFLRSELVRAGFAGVDIQKTPLGTRIVLRTSRPGLVIGKGGKRIRESTEILNSPKMRSLVAEMKSRYDNRYIIFDVPPLLAVADTVAFASVVDGIVMVIEEGKTSLPDVKKAVELIPRDKLLGYVMNKQGGLMKTAYGK